MADEPAIHLRGLRQRALLTLAVTLTLTMAGLLLWSAFRDYRFSEVRLPVISRIEELRGQILLFDEVLTMSARMSAATADPAWEARYRRFEPQLDAALKEILRLAPAAGPAAAQTDAANAKLVGLEHRAFELVRLGLPAEAQQLLASDEYEVLKSSYASGMTAMNGFLKRVTDSMRAEHRSESYWIAVILGVAVPLLLFTWWMVMRERAQWRAALVDSNVRLQRQAVQLEQVLARLKHERRDATLLREFLYLVQRCNSMQELGEVVRQYCTKVFPPAPGAVYLRHPVHNMMERLAGWGEPQPAASFPPVNCWALRHGKAHRPHGDDLALACAHARVQAEDALCVPLNTQEGTIGLLHLEAPGDAQARAMADELSLMLSNLRLRESLREQAIRDALTGLHNRRYLEESIEREIAGARRSGNRLAVLMLDVDHFKRFNDEHGHEAGDAALRAIGRLLKGAVRASDLACRFGGEEFTVVLANCDLDMARGWAERLLASVRRLRLEHAGKSLPQVTLSMGLAMYPANGADSETLLQATDALLYDAKRAGRDRLAVASDDLGLPAALPGPQPELNR